MTSILPPPSPSPSADPAIRVVLLPRDINPMGTIFGGIILSYIDQAGAIEARKHGTHTYVTVAMREVVFHEPVFVGDIISFYTSTKKLGRTSVSVEVRVEAVRASDPKKVVHVTNAEVVYVAVDNNRRPVPIRA